MPRRRGARPARTSYPGPCALSHVSGTPRAVSLGAAASPTSLTSADGAQGTMSGMQWGRLQVDVNCRLRRGAWYRVTELASLKAVLDVNRQLLAVPHFLRSRLRATPALDRGAAPAERSC